MLKRRTCLLLLLYKIGTRQASLPGLRTGAPGKYFGKGQGSYRLLDERVRVYVAPPVEELNSTRVRCSSLHNTVFFRSATFLRVHHIHSPFKRYFRDMRLIKHSQLKPYVPWMTHFTPEQMTEQPFGKLPQGGLTGQIYLDYARGKKTDSAEVVLNADGEVISPIS